MMRALLLFLSALLSGAILVYLSWPFFLPPTLVQALWAGVGCGIFLTMAIEHVVLAIDRNNVAIRLRLRKKEYHEKPGTVMPS